jgi:hypothetical protein
MKKFILFFHLVAISVLSLAQTTDTDLKTQVQTTIKGKSYISDNAVNMYNAIINSKQSRFSSTASGTNTYTVSIEGVTTYTNLVIELKFANANTGASTLKIGALATVPIVSRSGAALTAGQLAAATTGASYTLSYNGTSFVVKDLATGGGGSGVASVTGDGVTGTATDPVINWPTPTDIGAQTIDGDLTAIGALSPSNDDIIQRKAGAWTNRTLAQYRTYLALVVDALNNGATTTAPSENAVFDALANKQDVDADLTTIAGLTATTDNFLVAVSSAWASRTPAQAKTTLALNNVDNTSDANKPVSTAQQAAFDLKSDELVTENLQTGNYTFVLADKDSKHVVMNSASPQNLTLPANSTVAFPIGSQLVVEHRGDGSLTVVLAGSVTALMPTGHTLNSKGKGYLMYFKKVLTDTWVLSGTECTTCTGLTTGDVTGTQDLFISSAGMWPRVTAGCAALARTEISTSLFNIQSLDFDAATDEFAQLQLVLPRKYNNGTITVVVYWTAASGSGDVIWSINGGAYSNDDPLSTALGTAQSVTDTFLAANDVHVTSATSAITLAGTPADADFLAIQISRDADNGSDTLNADAKLLGISIRITTDAAKDN